MSHMLDVDFLSPVARLPLGTHTPQQHTVESQISLCVLGCAGALLPGDQIKTIQGREFNGQGWDSLGRHIFDETMRIQ